MDLPEIGLGCANLMTASLPEFIETAARHGFRRISARPYAFAAALDDGLTEADLRQRLADADVAVTMIDGLTRGLPGAATRESFDAATLAVMPPDVLDPPDEETCFRAAEVLGARIVNAVNYMGTPVPLEQMAEAIGGICRRARARGLQIALEFVPDSGLPNLPSARAVVEACGEPNCAITLDVFHLDRSGGTVDDVRRLPPNAIAGIQVSDRTPPPAGSAHVPMGGRSLPGEGRLPLRDLLVAALENSPEATVDIEVLNKELSSLPVDETAARLADAKARLLAL